MKYLLFLFLPFLIGCPGTEMPKIDISLWAGDSNRDGITRAQEDRSMGCQEKYFDEFVCLTYDDLKVIYATLLKCKKWDTKISQENTKIFIDKNPDIHKNLFLKGTPTPNLSEFSESKPVL
jgi:hypothetical protein